MTQPTRPSARPPIILSETDAERLGALAVQNEHSSPLASELLLDEIARATIKPDSRVPDDVVGMNSVVEFVDEAHGRTRQVELVYPAEVDIGAGKISILTPIGAGLIGLRAGQSILWPSRDGQKRALRIVRVERGSAAE
jgi:regulator of nucleoside diphosphate kinase